MRLKSFFDRVYRSRITKFVFLASSVITILAFLGWRPWSSRGETSHTASSAVLSAPAAKSKSSTDKRILQESNGKQSPNVANVEHDVRIHYADPVADTGKDAHKLSGQIRPLAKGTTQISQGDQSPNISGVRGNVDLKYSSSSEKPAPAEN